MVGNKSESWRVRMGTGQELFSSQSHKSSLFPLCPSQFPLGTLPEPHFSLTPGNNTRKLWIQTDFFFFFNSCFFLGSRSSRGARNLNWLCGGMRIRVPKLRYHLCLAPPRQVLPGITPGTAEKWECWAGILHNHVPLQPWGLFPTLEHRDKGIFQLLLPPRPFPVSHGVVKAGKIRDKPLIPFHALCPERFGADQSPCRIGMWDEESGMQLCLFWDEHIPFLWGTLLGSLGIHSSQKFQGGKGVSASHPFLFPALP